MQNFKKYIIEDTDLLINESKEGANLHLEHLDDEVLNRGVSGARDAINFLQSLRDMLSGRSNTKVKTTTKWDGAPAVFAGINPENGKFFVGTKSVFAKNAKLNYTDADIDANHSGEGLNNKLKIALRYLPKLNIKGILQGDMMFTKDDLKIEKIDGVEYVIFQPNTLVYAIPIDSNLAKSIMSAQLGIVFHTSYTGKSMQDMKASFNIDINNLTRTKDVWFRDAYFVDVSGTVTFTEEETKHITSILSNIGRIFNTISPLTMNRISSSEELLLQIKTFNNSKIREGKEIKDTNLHTKELIAWVEKKLNKNVIDAKLEKTKLKRIAEKNEIMRFYRTNAINLKRIFDMQNEIVRAKKMIVLKLQEFKQVANTFIRTENGFRVTGPEGFVAVSTITGGAIKLVDRLEFSQANFNAAKNWVGK